MAEEEIEEVRDCFQKGGLAMFGAIHLDKIAGDDFFEVLRSLIWHCLPDGGTVIKILYDYSILFLILGILVGVSQCFFGYKLRRLWTAILMIVVCGCGGAVLAAELKLPVAALIGVTAGTAIVGGLLGYFLWIIGCFFRPFAVISISVFAVFVINDMHTLGLIIALAAGLIAGIVSVAFYKVCLILYTSIFGGGLTGVCMAGLVGGDMWYLSLIVGGVLAVVGIIVQLLAGRNTKEAVNADGKEQSEEALEVPAAKVQEPDSFADAAKTEDSAAAEIYAQSAGEAEFAAAAETEGCEGAVRADISGNAEPVTEAENTAADNAFTDNVSDTDGAANDVCPVCGAPHSARAKFCMQCGQKLIG